jgi:phosphatidylglycerophosphate synthase
MINKNDPKLAKARLIIAKPFLTIHPNILTVAGACFAPIFFYFLVNHSYIFASAAYILSSFDAIDGIVARATQRVTLFGEFLDATFDRVADGFIITAFGFAHLVSFEIIISLLILSYLISYISARAGEAGKGSVKITKGMISLQDRRVILFFAVLSVMLFPTQRLYGFSVVEIIFLLLTVLSFVTVVQRMLLAYKLLTK